MLDAKATERNANLMILEGTLFWASLAFLQGDTIVTNFIRLTTGSVALAGFAATIRTFAALVGQFVAGLFIHRLRSHSRFMALIGFISRPLFLLMIPFLLAGVTGPAAAWMFLSLYTAFFFMDGMVGLCWIEICTRTLPIARRGEVISLQQTFAGLAGLGAGWVLRTVLGSALSFQSQYAVIFGIAGLLMVIDGLALAMIRDVPHSSAPDQPVIHPVRYVARLLPILRKNVPVRNTLIARALCLMTLISAPLNLMFGRSAGLSESQLATLVFMPVAGQIVAGVLWARVSRRLSYPIMMLMAEALGVACAVMNLVSYFTARAGLPVMVPLSIAMVLVAVNAPAFTGFTQHMITLVEPEKRSDSVVLMAIVIAPMSFGTYFAGLIVERAGYLPVYLLMLVSGTIGWFLVRRIMAVMPK